MNIEIPFLGHTNTPSDLLCKDGQAALSIGLIPENGAMHPVPRPGDTPDTGFLMGLGPGMRVVCIHRTAEYRHLIILEENENGTRFWWADPDRPGDIHGNVSLLAGGDTAEEAYTPVAIGNTLILLTSLRKIYFLWRGEDYARLGDSLPDIPLSFSLKASQKAYEGRAVLEARHVNDDKSLNSDGVTAVMALANKAVADIADDGRFSQPFLVRYALRLYDGTLACQSAPMLMACTSGQNPVIYRDNWDERPGHGNEAYDYHVKAFGYTLTAILDPGVYSDLADGGLDMWKDIIRAVDIFVSAPIYTYDQGLTRYDNDQYEEGNTWGEKYKEERWPLPYGVYDNSGLGLKDGDADINRANCRHSLLKEMGIQLLEPTPDNNYYCVARDVALNRTATAIADDIRSASTFYLLKSLSLDSDGRGEGALGYVNDLTPGRGYLASLANREAMTDDYRSHDAIIARRGYGFNGRLNLAGVSRRLFSGFPLSGMAQLTGGTDMDTGAAVHVFFSITEGGKDIVTQAPGLSYVYAYRGKDGKTPDPAAPEGFDEILSRAPVLYLFYPNPAARSAIVVVEYDGYRRSYTVPLKRHATLFGAYYFNGFSGMAADSDVDKSDVVRKVDQSTLFPDKVSGDGERTVPALNSVFTSAVNNPFSFPAAGVNAVGTGEVLAVCAAVRALSQGQFGQFPLYAFTTDGVWGLSATATGDYAAVQPVTRDVCADPDGICQLDGAILFRTARGVMLLEGSATTCFTEDLDDLDHLPPQALPAYGRLLAIAGYPGDAVTAAPSFRAFLESGARCLYDYAHARVVLYSPACSLAYVRSLREAAWGMAVTDIAYGLNSYPGALAVTHPAPDGTRRIVDFSFQPPAGAREPGLLITRPLKLGAPAALKTLRAVIAHGFFRKSSVRLCLMGSRDLRDWFVVATADGPEIRAIGGTPYRYFRLAVITGFAADESLQSFAASFQTRQTARLR